jgi:hypothetical protein
LSYGADYVQNLHDSIILKYIYEDGL